MTLIAALVGLALVDSTSIGTLIVPVWLLLAPDRPPARRLLCYLAAIAVFYFALGLLLLTVAGAGLDRLGTLTRSPVLLVPQLLLGIALFAVSWRFDSKKRRARGEPDRTAVWRARARGPPGRGPRGGGGGGGAGGGAGGWGGAPGAGGCGWGGPSYWGFTPPPPGPGPTRPGPLR
ncbi:GAP family protein [Nocardia wallacei]|uniref:GAP family protein n=1 Tax=Nocardia wallacei TaxID=480035 RepID=UPI002456589B|nr:GAP family protein [Nocardia wallacei]